MNLIVNLVLDSLRLRYTTSRFLPARLILGCSTEGTSESNTRVNIQRYPTLDRKKDVGMYSSKQKRYTTFVMFCFPPREVLLNVTNELYETDVYNVMGVIKGSTLPGKLSNSTNE